MFNTDVEIVGKKEGENRCDYYTSSLIEIFHPAGMTVKGSTVWGRCVPSGGRCVPSGGGGAVCACVCLSAVYIV